MTRMGRLNPHERGVASGGNPLGSSKGAMGTAGATCIQHLTTEGQRLPRCPEYGQTSTMSTLAEFVECEECGFVLVAEDAPEPAPGRVDVCPDCGGTEFRFTDP